MRAERILQRKGRDTITIDPGATLGRAVEVLSTHDIGALVVTSEKENVLGVLSERDIVHLLAERGEEALQLQVRNVMSREVLTCTPEDAVKDLMARVTRHRVRHLPVLRDGTLSGIISIGDLLKTRIEEIETEQKVLRDRLLDC